MNNKFINWRDLKVECDVFDAGKWNIIEYFIPKLEQNRKKLLEKSSWESLIDTKFTALAKRRCSHWQSIKSSNPWTRDYRLGKRVTLWAVTRGNQLVQVPMGREAFKLWDLVRLILETLRYLKPAFWTLVSPCQMFYVLPRAILLTWINFNPRMDK